MQHSVQPRFRKVVQSASAAGAYLAQWGSIQSFSWKSTKTMPDQVKQCPT
jgi:hypothetical protein